MVTPWGLSFDRNGNLYAFNGSNGGNTIEKFDLNGNKSAFASDMDMPMLWGLAFDNSGNLFAAAFDAGTIEKFDSSGNMSVSASGLMGPVGIAVEIPEPATLLLLGLGGLMLRKKR